MSFDSRLSAEAKTYLEEKKVPQLIEHLFHELAVAMPNDPLTFLQGILSKAPKPRITLLGAPSSGKSSLAAALSKKYQVPVINFDALLRNPQNQDAAQKIATAPNSRAADALCGKLVAAAAVKAAASEGGWILDGFPRTRNEAIELQAAGVLPALVIVLDASEETLQAREENNNNNDNVDFASRSLRKRVFSFNSKELYECFPIGRLRVHVEVDSDNNSSIDEVVAKVEPQIRAILA
jgi:adenylate kinase family enzyme